MRYLTILISLMLFSVIAYGQRTTIVIDSLTRALDQVGKDQIERVDILNELGYRYWIVNSNQSVKYGTEALQLAEELSYSNGIAFAKRVLGVSYWTMGRPKLALENLTSAQQTYEEIDDLEGAANCLMNTGMVYADIGEFQRALEIYDKSIERFSKLNLNRRIATTFTKIGSVLLKTGQLEEAREYLTNALNMHSEDEYDYGISEAHNRLAILSLQENELELADYHIKKSMEIGQKVNDEDGLISNLILLGKLQRFQGNLEDSETQLLRALELAQKKKLQKYQLSTLGELKELRKQQGRLEESLHYYDAFNRLKDSIFDTDKSKQIAALEFGQELADKEQEIALLREREKNNKIINWSLGIGSLSLIVIGFLLLMNQRQRNNKKQELMASRQELSKTALENARLKEQELQQKLEFKNKELTSYTLNFVQKNELLQQLQSKINEAREAPAAKQSKLLEQLARSIRQHVNIDRDWEDFRRFFEKVHTNFFKILKDKHPDLSSNDLKICSLTRLNLNVKETASILGISPESAKTARYRLRKKLDMAPEEELLDYFLRLEATV